MKPGSVRRLKLPAELADGEEGHGDIPGNATLVLEIELFEVTRPGAGRTGSPPVGSAVLEVGVYPYRRSFMTRLSLSVPITMLAFALVAAAPVPKHLMPKSELGTWKKLDSGLEIMDVKEGMGAAVKPGATVTVHYTGWLTDEKATKFDSSRDRGEKVTFGLGQVIKGWQEGVPGMKPGGVRRLRVPAALGYGAKGAGGLIPPNATLVFEIELFEAK